ncbi:MAG: TetR/AcrR family transcriptional regulator, partial [Proteobacteria bacterium]|nr:TetR/AcrR family transcriptional regulator [Pseudomonadota bacterium]
KLAAIKVFSTKGYDQATMDDLMVEAGVSKSLIYWYWSSKHALLAELVDTCMIQYRDLLRESLESDTPFPEKIHKLLEDYLELQEPNTKLNRLVHFCSIHTSKKNGEGFSKQVKEWFAEVLGLLEAIFAQGMEQGHLREDLDPAGTALILLSFVEGYIYLSILEERPPLDQLLRPMLSGIVSSALRQK